MFLKMKSLYVVVLVNGSSGIMTVVLLLFLNIFVIVCFVEVIITGSMYSYGTFI